jgi:hypothetical protein
MRGAGEDAPKVAQLLATWAVPVDAEEVHHDANADGVGFGVGGVIGDQEVVVEKLEMMMTVLPQEARKPWAEKTDTCHGNREGFSDAP